ncbi:MAG: hypothetical protein AB7F96_02465 [Beijerinckiaceae bacterium]
MNQALGISMILVFCLSQAFRDVYLGAVFQQVDFFAVILLAFIPSTLIFGLFVFVRHHGNLRALRNHAGTVAAMNVTTALAWTSYFFGLAHIEPAVVNTLHSGVAPLTVVALSALGFSIAGSHKVRFLEALFLAGMTVTLAGLWWAVLSGRTGAPAGSDLAMIAALALLILSGASITISHLFSRKLAVAGIDAATITSSRYILIVAAASVFLLMRERPSGIESFGHGVLLSVAAGLLIALPLYALQIGIAHTPQLMAHVLRAAGPVFVFALERFDGRLTWTATVLTLIVAYSIFVSGANIAHVRATRAPEQNT